MVNVKGKTQKGRSDFCDILIDDLPDGGTNALNLNRSLPLRSLTIYLFYTLSLFILKILFYYGPLLLSLLNEY